MLFHAVIFLIFSYITFKLYPSTANILAWFFVGLGVVINYISGQEQLLFLAYISFLFVLTLTTIVTKGDFY